MLFLVISLLIIAWVQFLATLGTISNDKVDDGLRALIFLWAAFCLPVLCIAAVHLMG